MHILEIPSFMPPLGGEFCLEQARALKARGHEVRVISCNQLGLTINLHNFIHSRWDRWKEDMMGVEVFRTNMRGMPKVVKYNQKHWCSIVISLYEEYKKQYGKPDVLHAHCCLWGGVVARMISEREHIPYYITEHLSSGLYSAFGNDWSKHLWARTLLQETFEKATCVIPVCDELMDDIAPFFERNYRHKTISNIVDVDFFAYQERKPKEGRAYKYCCLARADIYGKGFDVLREAFKSIPNAELHIAGRDTDGNEFRDFMSGVPNVNIHGNLTKEQVRDLLYECDSLVLASRSEAQPLVLLESMSTGIPVISTECTPQIERIPGACLIAKTGDAVSLRQQMLEVQQLEPSIYISKEARKICSPDAVAKQIEELFAESILKK